MTRSNYHTHTYRCGHATGDIAAYADIASRYGMSDLGFSEHMPLPSDRWAFIHLAPEGLEEYIKAVGQGVDDYPGLSIHLGGECEYLKADHAYYREFLLGELGLDYLLGAPHWICCEGTWKYCSELESVSDLRSYASYCVDVISSGLFAYLAHPDIFLIGKRGWDSEAVACANDIFDAALEYDLPLELNANGLRKSDVTSINQIARARYPNLSFWQLASSRGVKTIIGSDAHAPRELTDRVDICQELAGMLALDLIDELSF